MALLSKSSRHFLKFVALFYAFNVRGRLSFKQFHVETSNLLVNPSGELGGLPVEDLGGGEPEGDLLLGVLDGVGTVADVAADILLEV